MAEQIPFARRLRSGSCRRPCRPCACWPASAHHATCDAVPRALRRPAHRNRHKAAALTAARKPTHQVAVALPPEFPVCESSCEQQSQARLAALKVSLSALPHALRKDQRAACEKATHGLPGGRCASAQLCSASCASAPERRCSAQQGPPRGDHHGVIEQSRACLAPVRCATLRACCRAPCGAPGRPFATAQVSAPACTAPTSEPHADTL